jgi:hypothetical protein
MRYSFKKKNLTLTIHFNIQNTFWERIDAEHGTFIIIALKACVLQICGELFITL